MAWDTALIIAMSLEELKRRILDKCDIAQALVALNRAMTPRELDIFNRTRALLNHGTRDQLEHAEFVLDVNIQTAENVAGYKGGSQFLLDLGEITGNQSVESFNIRRS